MNEYNINIGIDVAKNHLDVCILPYGKTKRFKNNELGIASLIEFIVALQKTPSLLGAEC